MSRLRIFVCCVALLAAIGGCAKKATPGGRTEDEREVGELEIKVSEAFAAKDLDKLVSLYADNAALYDDSAPIILGKNAIREAWRVDFARPGLTLNTEPRTVEISNKGDLAWTHGLFLMTTYDAAGIPAVTSWDYALVYTRQPDGSWKIMADSVQTTLRARYLQKPPKGSSPYAPLAPLIGIACLAGSIWFLIGMPVVVIVYARKYFRSGKLPTGFLVSAVMFVVFLVTALLFWRHLSTYYWNLSFANAWRAAGDTARYGNPVEDTAESVLVSLLVISPLAAIAAGVLTGAARWIWTRKRRPAA